ncbi:hypothetical protein GR925_30700 [Streptomyces sp. HUCO-GS316]|uniref:TRADD-N-associated membrane domain-containing protein n=1 Tax=Streptomyces sp. HUCO-GS316 TaxID=2692198 RepID=UPI001370599F|nr:hypothetical protein [Streptomyces sp. HUCO-GS316]MXM67689.1 hypothetical protein [Streptomyces sp. HUCO-GS316]
MDPLVTFTTLAASSLATAGGEAWKSALERLRSRQSANEPQNDGPSSRGHDADGSPSPPDGADDAPAPAASPSQAALSALLEEYYTKVGRRADVSFFAAIAAAVLGYLIITAGILVGIYHSDDMVLAVVTTASGIFSQVLSFFFFRNRAEERKMMIQALGDLRQDAERDGRASRALELVCQVQQHHLRDNLAAAIALELSGVSPDLKNLHGSLQLFATHTAPAHSNGHAPSDPPHPATAQPTDQPA